MKMSEPKPMMTSMGTTTDYTSRVPRPTQFEMLLREMKSKALIISDKIRPTDIEEEDDISDVEAEPSTTPVRQDDETEVIDQEVKKKPIPIFHILQCAVCEAKRTKKHRRTASIIPPFDV